VKAGVMTFVANCTMLVRRWWVKYKRLTIRNLQNLWRAENGIEVYRHSPLFDRYLNTNRLADLYAIRGRLTRSSCCAFNGKYDYSRLGFYRRIWVLQCGFRAGVRWNYKWHWYECINHFVYCHAEYSSSSYTDGKYCLIELRSNLTL